MISELVKRIISSIFLLPLIFFFIIKGSYLFNIFLILTLIIAVYEWHRMTKNKSYNILGFFFLLLSFLSVYKLRNNIDNNYYSLLMITLICILTDIGGYVFGKLFKGPKLSSYSPNKTYAGAIGGLFLSICSIPFFLSYNMINNQTVIAAIIFIFIISIISQIGDIIISYFKRNSKIKDTGNIIPGHGGLLDRIDGMIFAFPISYILLSISFFENALK